MPGKHVHFASEDVISTPVLSYAGSSLSSSSSTPPPSTPLSFESSPPVAYNGSPYACVPLPALHTIHPILAQEFVNILYDVSLHPNSIQCRVPTPPHVWDEPASKPGLYTVDIISHFLPWRITIHSRTPGKYITVRDVLDQLYTALRINVTPAEYAGLTSVDAQMQVNDAYRRRYKRITDARRYDEEKLGGVKRVDFLGVATRFGGFACSSQGSNTWRLFVA